MGQDVIIIIDRTARGGAISIERFEPGQHEAWQRRYEELRQSNDADLFLVYVSATRELPKDERARVRGEAIAAEVFAQVVADDCCAGARAAFYGASTWPEDQRRILESYAIALGAMGFEHPDPMDENTKPRRKV